MKLAIALFLLVILSGMRFDSVKPSSAKAGTTLTISGDNFGKECEVTIGRKVAEIKGLSEKEIVIVAPPHSKGKKMLAVRCSDRMPLYQLGAFEYTE